MTEPERRLLEVLSWLAPEPIPLFLFEAAPLAEAIARPPRGAGGPGGLLAGAVRRVGRRGPGPPAGAGDHPRPHPRGRPHRHLKIALDAVNAVAPYDADDVRTWAVWTPLAAHAEAVGRSRRRGRDRRADGPADESTGPVLAGPRPVPRRRAALPPGAGDRRAQLSARTTPRRHPPQQPGGAAPGHQPAGRGRAALPPGLAIDERSYGPDHPNVATALNNLAALLQATNRLAEAEPLYRRALAIDERSYGPDHPDVASRLNNLAALLQATNRLAEAEPLYRRALAIDERSYGPDHPDVASDLNNLAELLRATNRLAEAEPLYRRALAIDERSYRPGPPRRRHPPQQPGGTAAGHQPAGRGRAALPPGAGDRRAELSARTTPTSPSASTTWRSCCGPPTGWPRPSRYRGAPCRS